MNLSLKNVHDKDQNNKATDNYLKGLANKCPKKRNKRRV
jgi:membrane-bound lytic murein transglycosylase MltF